MSVKKNIPTMFLVMVVVPTLCASAYLSMIASDVYVSESRFVVRNAAKTSGASLAQMALGAATGGVAGVDSYAVIDYLKSRDAAKQLDSKNYIRINFGRYGDFFSRYHSSWNDTDESVWNYYKSHIIDVDIDDDTAIITLKTNAYSADQARNINIKLVAMSERLVNEMNDRAMHDAVDAAQQQVVVYEQKAQNAAEDLAVYRNSKGVYNPDQQSMLQFQALSQMQLRLSSAQSQLRQLNRVAPNSPQIAIITANIGALNAQIAKSNSLIMGSKSSFAGKGPDYTALVLKMEFASRQLEMAMTSMEDARSSALRKHLYLEELVSANYPTEAIKPRRLHDLVTVIFLSLLAWAATKMFVESVLEHRD